MRLLRLLQAPRPGGRLCPLPQEAVFAKLDELLALGGDLAAFNGGFNPHLPLDYYCDLFSAIRHRYGDTLEFYALTIAEFLYLADHAKLSYAEAAARFKAAGVRWITGGGSEILTEDFRRRHSKFKYTVVEYFAAQRAILEAGLEPPPPWSSASTNRSTSASSTLSAPAPSRTK